MTGNRKLRSTHAWLIGLILAFIAAGSARAVTPTPPELRHAQAWARFKFASAGPRRQIPPFSFVYDGKPSAELLKRWKFIAGPSSHEGSKRLQNFAYRDPATGLELTCELMSYDDFPAVEWVLHFKNDSAKPSAILADVRALDTSFKGSSWVLHRALGSNAAPTDFSPVDQSLAPGTQIDLAPTEGRSSDTTSLPFFNVTAPAEEGCRAEKARNPQQVSCGGVMIGLGWSGQWSASFRGALGAVELKMGMQKTHLRPRAWRKHTHSKHSAALLAGAGTHPRQ